MRGYVVAGALGVLITVAFYEGERGLAKNSLSAAPGAARAAPCAGPGEAVETARQQLADSLMRCQAQLIERERGIEGWADVGQVAGNQVSGSNEAGTAAIAGGTEESVQDRTDPSAEEWRELAKKGELRLNRPCPMEPDWVPDQAALASGGLDAREAQGVAEAYRLAGQRASEMALANCAAWLGTSPLMVERIGAENCESILDEQAERVPGVFRRVAEMRAGLRSESEAQSAPIEKYYLAKTREWQTFESDLARRVGAERAHRITQSPAFCMSDERWPAPPDSN
jgi:hypothetical protein